MRVEDGGERRLKEVSHPPNLTLEGSEKRASLFSRTGTPGNTRTCAVDSGACLWETVPTPVFSLSAFQLILTIVGSIAGILLLGMLIALILVRYGKEVSLFGAQRHRHDTLVFKHT